MNFKGLFHNYDKQPQTRVTHGGGLQVTDEGILIIGNFGFTKRPLNDCPRHMAIMIIDWALDKLLHQRSELVLGHSEDCTCPNG